MPSTRESPEMAQTLLEILNDPAHEQYEEMREWVGDRFDPEQFDPDLVKFDNPKKRWQSSFESRDRFV